MYSCSELKLLAEHSQPQYVKFDTATSGIYLDLSFQCLPQASLALFHSWLNEVDLSAKIKNLISGAKINRSESTPALYSALRDLTHPELLIDGKNVALDIKNSLQKLSRLVQAINTNEFLAYNDSTVTDIVHIGVGGSALGPELCYNALRDYRKNNINVHFLSTMDESAAQDIFTKLNANSTLVFLASKSFSTEEMLVLADYAKAWLNANNCDPAKHFVAATAQVEKAVEYGVKEANILPFGPWIGGRFSVWSTVSFSLAIVIGMDAFNDFLNGAHAMDKHFCSSPLLENIPVLLACLSAWHTEINDRQAHAIIPYTAKLELLPSYLQQLHMESLGKSVTVDGVANKRLASPVIFGDIGTRSQHSLSQYFMQAPTTVPLDILYLDKDKDSANQRLKVHAKAQSKVLTDGFEDSAHPYKDIKPHHPHSLITVKELTPSALGELLAMYEHKVFTLGVMYNINPFDQWGVERGKIIAKQILEQEINNE